MVLRDRRKAAHGAIESLSVRASTDVHQIARVCRDCGISAGALVALRTDDYSKIIPGVVRAGLPSYKVRV